MNLKLSHLRGAMIFLTIGLSFLLFSCDQFNEVKTDISGVDEIACMQLSDTNYFEISLKALTDFDTLWVDSMVTEYVPNIIDTLLANDLVLHAGLDTAYKVNLQGLADSCYAALQADISNLAFFYTECLDLNIYSYDGQLVERSSEVMPPETISGCRTETDKGLMVPLIKIRYEYNLTGNKYLLQFIKPDNTVIDNVYLTILNAN